MFLTVPFQLYIIMITYLTLEKLNRLIHIIDKDKIRMSSASTAH